MGMTSTAEGRTKVHSMYMLPALLSGAHQSTTCQLIKPAPPGCRHSMHADAL